MPYVDPVVAKAYHKNYYEKNKETQLAIQKEKYARSTPEEKQKKVERNKEWIKAHPEYQLWKQAKDSSKQRGLDFTITQEDIIIPTHCPYLGIALTNIRDGGRQDTNISLDRIDNTKGYVKDNIQVISSKANYMKRDATIPELLAFAKGVLNTHL